MVDVLLLGNPLDVLPETVEVFIHNSKEIPVIERFLGALHDAKKNIRELTFGEKYFKDGKGGPVLLNLTAKWLAILPIHALRFDCAVPTEILDMLNLAPNIGSLHLPNLEQCAGVALSECKLLRKLSERVEQVIDIVEGTMIRDVEVVLPTDCKRYPRSDMMDLAISLFLEHGWHKQYERPESKDQHGSLPFVQRNM